MRNSDSAPPSVSPLEDWEQGNRFYADMGARINDVVGTTTLLLALTSPCVNKAPSSLRRVATTPMGRRAIFTKVSWQQAPHPKQQTMQSSSTLWTFVTRGALQPCGQFQPFSGSFIGSFTLRFGFTEAKE